VLQSRAGFQADEVLPVALHDREGLWRRSVVPGSVVVVAGGGVYIVQFVLGYEGRGSVVLVRAGSGVLQLHVERWQHGNFVVFVGRRE
jgi:hypothetical protein